jgi:hypothetical protein
MSVRRGGPVRAAAITVYRRRTSPAKSRRALRTATRNGQLASRDRDQPVLRRVLQIEQLDEGRGGSVATWNDVSEQRCRFAMVLAA